MANFKTHTWWGAVLAIILLVAGTILSLIHEVEAFFWIFIAVLVGSFLPDLDLDDGIPFQIIFGIFGISVAGLIFLSLYQQGVESPRELFGFPMVAFVVSRFGIGYVFKKITHHRGMFHSIPAAFLAGIGLAWLARFLELSKQLELLIGFGAFIGYIGHLFLDEIYSTVAFNGLSFHHKKSLGSALKWTSSSGITTVFFYLALLVFAVGYFG